jgi:hypothetical protein
VPNPDGVVRLNAQVNESGRTLLAYADDRNHGRVELRPDVLVWQADDPARSWYAPYQRRQEHARGGVRGRPGALADRSRCPRRRGHQVTCCQVAISVKRPGARSTARR